MNQNHLCYRYTNPHRCGRHYIRDNAFGNGLKRVQVGLFSPVLRRVRTARPASADTAMTPNAGVAVAARSLGSMPPIVGKVRVSYRASVSQKVGEIRTHACRMWKETAPQSESH